jgi:hypothetical protein
MINRIGQKFMTNEGYEIEIIKKITKAIYTISFEDGTLLNKDISQIKKGEVKNPNHKSVLGVGYIGIGEYKIRKNGKVSKSYTLWRNMLQRCYCPKFKKKHTTYKDCYVSEEWHNFQNFAEWVDENYIEGFELDKDILQKGNKFYSKEKCFFIPKEINTLLIKCDLVRGHLPIGVNETRGKFSSHLSKKCIRMTLGYYDTPEEAFEAYKNAKEKHIKEIAEEYKSQITEQVYQALMNYEVNIND